MRQPTCSASAPPPPGGETRNNMVVNPERRQSHRISLFDDLQQRCSRKMLLDRINR
jgi:hypothetical protein